MFLHAIEGSWLSHPFWRRRFLLRSDSDIAALRDAGIAFVTIDTARGLAPVEEPEPIIITEPIVANVPTGITAERERAVDIVARTRDIIRSVFEGARLGKAIDSDQVAAVVDEISESVQRNAYALISIVRLKSKDDYSYLHSVAVCALMVNFARHLGLADETVREFGLAGLVHDIGKMDVPSEILNKPGRLTDEEFAIARLHPERGCAILDRAEAIPATAIDVCRHHHEKIDGTGYPFGLKGGEISLAARMGAICDVYDALTSDRAYKDAWSPIEAVTAMQSWDGQFDRDLLFTFYQSIAVFPVGLVVRLRSQRLAVVLPNGRRASRPRLRVFYDTVSKSLVDPRDITLADDDACKTVVRQESATDWGAHDWPALRDHLLQESDKLDGRVIERLWTGVEATSAATIESPVESRVARWRPSQRLD
jgi:HD-GYP domain-containing protein (c-di-GMP phosphodiesterase class II)